MPKGGEKRYEASSRMVLDQPAQARLMSILGLIMIMYMVSTPSL
ncbi:MAG: hypothetical protein ACJ72M_21100 [Propionibacteriaceae bacterium]